MKPELILHIGLEKTGTTSIQKSLASVRRTLINEESVLYPNFSDEPNHIKLCIYALDTLDMHSLHTIYVKGLDEIDAFRFAFEKELREEVQKSGCKRVIMSSEHLSSNLGTVEQIKRLKKIFDPIFSKVEILVYLRRQDRLLLSRYSTQIKAGEYHDFTTTAELFSDINFEALLARWSQVFGQDNINVRWFDKACFVKGSLLRDFQAATGLKINLPDQTLNPSLDVVKLSYLREFNSHYAGIRGKPLRIKRRNLVGILEEVEELGPRLELSSDQSIEILSKNEKSNAAVLKRYASGNGTPDLKPLSSGEGTSLSDVDGRQAIKISHAIWDSRVPIVERLNSRLEKANKQRKYYRKKLTETKDFDYVLELEANLKRQNAQVAFFQAEATRERKEHEEASRFYQKAINLAPKNKNYLKRREENKELHKEQLARLEIREARKKECYSEVD